MTKYSPGDEIRVTNPFNEHYGTVGTILRHDNDDDSYLIEFQFDSPFGPSAVTDWFYGTTEFTPASNTKYMPKSNAIFYCNHEWKVDYTSIFTSAEYYSCKHCGKKKEDV